MTSSNEFTQSVMGLLYSEAAEGEFGQVDACTFEEATILTQDDGLVVTLPDGSEFQVTVVKVN